MGNSCEEAIAAAAVAATSLLHTRDLTLLKILLMLSPSLTLRAALVVYA